MRVAIGLLLFSSIVVVQQHAAQPAAQNFSRPSVRVGNLDPAMHLQVSNSSLRVFRIDLAPHAAAAIGRDIRDYMLLAVTDGAAEVVGPGNAFPVDLKSGEIEIFKGGWPHQLRSKSETPTSWMVLELSRDLHPERASCGLGGPGCSQFRFGKTEQGEYNESVLFDTPAARVLRAELAPASTLPTHADTLGHLVVPITECSVALNGTAENHKAGESIFVRGGTDLRNTGSASARFVILEIK